MSLFCCAAMLPADVSQAAQGGPVISEFLAVNSNGLLDKDHDSSDWIEIYNPTGPSHRPRRLVPHGQHAQPRQMGISARVDCRRADISSCSPRARTSGSPAASCTRASPCRPRGESVALVQPDGATVAHAYVDYPPQVVDISYGLSSDSVVSQTETVLLAEGADARALIPANGSLGLNWTLASFNDAAWLAGKTGVGYDYAGLIQARRRPR